MRSHEELFNAAGQPNDFDGLIHILDSETRLITPADLEAKENEGEPESVSPPKSDARYYQLTHDYLVHSLPWLTQAERDAPRPGGTATGRSCRHLDEPPENKQLPSLWHWLQIRFWTCKRSWTEPQRKMMKKARATCRGRSVVVASILILGSLLAWDTVGRLETRPCSDDCSLPKCRVCRPSSLKCLPIGVAQSAPQRGLRSRKKVATTNFTWRWRFARRWQVRGCAV